MQIAVAGATGFVGRRLVEALAGEHKVIALARRAPDFLNATNQAVDVGNYEEALRALEGCDAAYYLIHSLDVGDFRARDLDLAKTFGAAAKAAGVKRIVYLGGLGEDPTSDHLLSRQEVGAALGAKGVPVVELRAAVIIGAGSVSYEMLRYLTERLPFMVCPRWVRTAIEPIALSDVLLYLEKSLSVEPGIYEVGCGEVTTYRDMISIYARERGLGPTVIVDIPLLTPRLSSHWVDFVTPVDTKVSHSLIESLVTEVTVRDPNKTKDAFAIIPMPIAQAIREALDNQLITAEATVMDRESGLLDGIYTERIEIPIDEALESELNDDFDRIGGDLDWYGLDSAWRIRMWIGRLFGERWRLRRPEAVEPDAAVDWWRVVERSPNELVLRAEGWFFGEGWLGWRVRNGVLVQVGILRPKGVVGFLYWKILQPVHRKVFRLQAEHRLVRARRRIKIGQ
ncbi:unannotated protein [freshwater metagenome]|uniref:Unannotated protein n=1 Tax=freshwater metagenome TaxID=449393 RepID=A0A6J7RD12_9ZZZZ|nr:DUF2867 domain-containing protein [Actinomycetota bacterium]MSV94266.1 DUF2867 domain-containing protein [Actinomycetota bacterium]MSY45180.1 DUF2867 domain-containing protein [Actinomycetota bacterium]